MVDVLMGVFDGKETNIDLLKQFSRNETLSICEKVFFLVLPSAITHLNEERFPQLRRRRFVSEKPMYLFHNMIGPAFMLLHHGEKFELVPTLGLQDDDVSNLQIIPTHLFRRGHEVSDAKSRLISTVDDN